MKETLNDTIDEFNFVLCPSFHGASLLAILLNNHPSVLSLGDTAPTRATTDLSCSCGSIIKDCEFWKLIYSTQRPYNHARSDYIIPLLPNLETKNIERINRLNENYRKLFAPWRLFPFAGGNFKKSVDLFTKTALNFHDKSIFVDGTKDINRCLSIKNITNKKIKVIHLIRDPRGYLRSLRKNTPQKKIDLKNASNMWKGFHSLALHFFPQMQNCRYLPVYYENLALRPGPEMERIFDFLGVPYHDIFNKPESPHHLIGNRMIVSFDGKIRQDMEWQDFLSPGEQAKLIEYCEPISSLLGYGVGNH